MLRHVTVGVPCVPTGSSPILKWAASYALDWREVAEGIAQPVIELNMGDDSCNKTPIYIYWDIDTCIIPDEIRCSEEWMSKMTEKFQIILRKNGYYGQFRVFIYGVGISEIIKKQYLQANFMSFRPVPGGKGFGVKAVEMIQIDISARMLCPCNNYFMVISDGDTSGLKRLLKDHKLLVVRLVPCDFESMKIGTGVCRFGPTW